MFVQTEGVLYQLKQTPSKCHYREAFWNVAILLLMITESIWLEKTPEIESSL